MIDDSEIVRPVGQRTDGFYFQPPIGSERSIAVVASGPAAGPKRLYFVTKQPKKVFTDVG
jgi:hypothetical protein